MKHMIYATVFSLLFLTSAPLFAGDMSEISWKYKGTTFSGLYAQGKKGEPAIVIFHQWMGISDHEKGIASDLNSMGYTVLVADLYGKRNLPADRDGAKKISGTFYSDRKKFREHTTEAVKALIRRSGKQAGEIFAIGYCFGGSAALELARTGMGLKGFVSLHGGLANPNPADDSKIKGKVLILHGAEDRSVPLSDVNLLTENLRKYKKDFSVHIFADAVHGFTHKNDPERYNKNADMRSWQIMKDFFTEK